MTAASTTARCSTRRRYSPVDAVTVEGETRDYAGRHFCPRCGPSVFGRSGDEVEVNLGALDAPDHFVPTYELWTIRRESWLPPFPLERRFERDRESADRWEGPERKGGGLDQEAADPFAP